MIGFLASTVLALALQAQPQVPAPEPNTPQTAASPKPAGGQAPSWLRRPSRADVDQAYPRNALRKDIAGQVVMECTVDGAGKMTDCKILSETPLNRGFGAATLSLAPQFTMTATTPDGASVAGFKVSIPVTWNPG